MVGRRRRGADTPSPRPDGCGRRGRPRRAVVGALLLCAPLTTACSAPEATHTPRPTHPTHPTHPISVVEASAYPVAFLLERLAAGVPGVTVRGLAPPGTEPHDVDLDPQRLERLQQAAAVVLLGGGFQPALEKAVRSLPARVRRVALLPPDTPDPHIWLDPSAYAALAAPLERLLVQIAPGAQARVAANAQRLTAELGLLDRDVRNGLARCVTRTFVTPHDAFGRFAARYSLVSLALVGRSPEAEADPRSMARIVAQARAAGVTTVFVEPRAPRAIAATVAAEFGGGVEELDPVESIAAGSLADDYFTVMRRDLATLRTALRCR